MRNLKPVRLSVFFFALACERAFIKRLALNTDAMGLENRLFMGPENRLFMGLENRLFMGPENRLFMGPENRLFPGVSMHFSARKLYSWGSGGVKDNAHL